MPSSLVSGRGPRLSVLNRQATSILLKLLASICASGEYLLPRMSAVDDGQSPLSVLGCPTLCPETCGDHPHASPAATTTSASTTRNAMRFIH